MWLRLNKAKKPFILLEIVVALTLLSLCLPFISADTFSFKKELQKAAYLNQIENQLSRILFHHYYLIHKNSNYYSFVKEHSQGELLLNESIKLTERGEPKECPITMIFAHHEIGKNNDYSQIHFTLKVTQLPLKLPDYQTNEQNIYLKN